MKKLSLRQERFAREYIVDLNATQAAIRIGTPKKAAKVWASKQLALPHVKAAVAGLQKKLTDKQEITAARVLNELASIGFAGIDQLTGNRLRALELLGRHLKLFTDKVEWTSDDSFVRILEAARLRMAK